MNPLLSVITPTWQRNDLLMEMIENISAQTYRPLEMVIVSDGPDYRLDNLLCDGGIVQQKARTAGVPIRYHDLGRNFTTEGPPNSFGIGAITTGMLLARGEYLTVLCDDERMLVPDHFTKLVNLLEETGVDFTYPLVRIWRNGNPDGPETAIIGTDPPAYCQITHYVARASLLRKAMPVFGSHPVDWSLVRDWMAAGATWRMLPEITFSHRLDQP